MDDSGREQEALMTRRSRTAERISGLSLIFLFLGLAPRSASGQQSLEPDPSASVAVLEREAFQSRTYGTADTIIHQIPSAAFQLRSDDKIQEFNNGYVYAPNSAGTFVAPLNLP